MGSPAKVRVSLTPTSYLRFVPRVPVNATVLGVVQRGLQIGALARLADGAYAQVNGDIVQPLNRSQVEAALQEARQVAKLQMRRGDTRRATPTITVKRRRFTGSTLAEGVPEPTPERTLRANGTDTGTPADTGGGASHCKR